MNTKTLLLSFLMLAMLACNNAYSPIADVEKYDRYDVADTGDDLKVHEEKLTLRYGYLKADGTWAIEPQYKYAYDFRNGIAVVQMWNSAPHFGGINTRNQWVICPRFRSSSDVYGAISSIEAGRAQGVELWATENPLSGTYGYLDHYGEWALFPRWKSAYQFRTDGYAIVETMLGLWGAIDKSGEYVIQPVFSSSSDVSNALYRLSEVL